MDSIRAVSERLQLMKQAAAVLGASMQRRHDLASSETITKTELMNIVGKIWAESDQLLKSLAEKRINPEAQWINKLDSILSALMFQENGKLFYVELLLALTEKGRSFDPRLVYADITLAIDRGKEAELKAKLQPPVAAVTLQHVRDQMQDSSMADNLRNQLMLDSVHLALITAQRSAAAASADVGGAAGGGGGVVVNPAPRRGKRKSDMPTWHKEPWLPVRYCVTCTCLSCDTLARVAVPYDRVRRRERSVDRLHPRGGGAVRALCEGACPPPCCQ